MAEVDDWNGKIIAEFRANEGRVGGPFEGATMLLLHHTGARTGTGRVNPLVYRPEGRDYVVFASKGGHPRHPDWYHNLLAHPEVSVEVGTDTHRVRARELTGDDRDRIWEAQKRERPGFADYEEKIAGRRQIPVVLLERLD